MQLHGFIKQIYLFIFLFPSLPEGLFIFILYYIYYTHCVIIINVIKNIKDYFNVIKSSTFQKQVHKDFPCNIIILFLLQYLLILLTIVSYYTCVIAHLISTVWLHYITRQIYLHLYFHQYYSFMNIFVYCLYILELTTTFSFYLLLSYYISLFKSCLLLLSL